MICGYYIWTCFLFNSIFYLNIHLYYSSLPFIFYVFIPFDFSKANHLIYSGIFCLQFIFILKAVKAISKSSLGCDMFSVNLQILTRSSTYARYIYDQCIRKSNTLILMRPPSCIFTYSLCVYLRVFSR